MKLHSTMDAEMWAEEFLKINKDKLESLDLDTMRAWFANSIMCGYDTANQRRDDDAHKLIKLKELILLTDDVVSDITIGDTQLKQWNEFVREFPDEGER